MVTDMTKHVLDEILRVKEQEVAELAAMPPVSRGGRGPRGGLVPTALARGAGNPLRLVTEIKRKSPSAGPLSTALSVPDRALTYARGGATMISILCDSRFFDGSWAHVAEARRALDDAGLPLPILAKEFIIDPRQIEEAAVAGADAVLLIARIVDPTRLASLSSCAVTLGLEPLVEVVDEAEVRVALDAGARVIGVNARDLDTLEIDAARAARVLEAIPDDRIAVHLSGLKTPEDISSVARTSSDAALIGEALMRADDPAPLLRDFARAASLA
jgi:indole-3-glycerol phosphate synthase